jgi:hypothetical protein
MLPPRYSRVVFPGCQHPNLRPALRFATKLTQVTRHPPLFLASRTSHLTSFPRCDSKTYTIGVGGHNIMGTEAATGASCAAKARLARGFLAACGTIRFELQEALLPTSRCEDHLHRQPLPRAPTVHRYFRPRTALA